MKAIIGLVMLALGLLTASAQNAAQKIYETERAFERMASEKGVPAAFVEYLAPDGVMFFPEPANGRATYAKRTNNGASLTWNPILIDVSSNGVLAYSIGNSIYRPKGKGDPTGYAGHYLSIWMRQRDGGYRAVLDTGIQHEAPEKVVTEWRSPASVPFAEPRPSAADSSTGFFQLAAIDPVKAYKNYFADDVYLLRDGHAPVVGKKAAGDFLSKEKKIVRFAKRHSFVEASELAYHYIPYNVLGKDGKETERGHIVQVWKLFKDKWRIVADVLIPIPSK
jgi:ketosteroid isomerase-like protein